MHDPRLVRGWGVRYESVGREEDEKVFLVVSGEKKFPLSIRGAGLFGVMAEVFECGDGTDGIHSVVFWESAAAFAHE